MLFLRTADENVARWKQRYLDSLDELERKESQWATVEQRLRRALGRLTAAAYTGDPRLDHSLDRLRDALKADPGGDEVDRLIDEIARAAAGAEREPGPPGKDPLLALLDALEPPPAQARPWRALRKRLRRGLAPELALDEASTLLRECLAPLEPEPAHFEGDAGVAPEAGAADALNALLDELDFPERLGGAVQSLRGSLGAPLDPHELARVVARFADLVAEGREDVRRQREELEAFVRSVSERVELIEAHLLEAEQARRGSLEGGRSLQQSVRDQVAGLRTSVAAASDLGELRLAVLAGLDSVQHHIETYVSAEEDRAHALTQRSADLERQLRALEQEGAELRIQLAHQREQASRDHLTGLYNRRGYADHLARALARAERYGEPLALVSVDIDLFKAINDRYGHQAGDKVLKTLASRLRRGMRESDILARYGGEEFVALLPHTDAAAALEVAEKLRESVAGCDFHYRRQPVRVTVSCGVAQAAPGEGPEATLARADAALYRAKEKGRNRCEAAAPA